MITRMVDVIVAVSCGGLMTDVINILVSSVCVCVYVCVCMCGGVRLAPSFACICTCA